MLATLPFLRRLRVLTLNLSANDDVIALPTLTSLHLYFFECLGIPLAATAPNLQDLGCGAIPDPTAYPHMFSHAVMHDLFLAACNHLSTLPALSQLPNLQDLMVCMQQGCAAMVKTLVQGASDLLNLAVTSIDSDGCTDLDDRCVEAIITTLPHLAQLCLSKGGSSISDHSLVLLSRLVV